MIRASAMRPAHADGKTAANPATPDVHAMYEHASTAARLLRMLGDESRLLVLCHLAKGERSVSELNALVEPSQSALSQHLAVLRNDGMIATRLEAQTIYYPPGRRPGSGGHQDSVPDLLRLIAQCATR